MSAVNLADQGKILNAVRESRTAGELLAGKVAELASTWIPGARNRLEEARRQLILAQESLDDFCSRADQYVHEQKIEAEVQEGLARLLVDIALDEVVGWDSIEDLIAEVRSLATDSVVVESPVDLIVETGVDLSTSAGVVNAAAIIDDAFGMQVAARGAADV